MEVAIARRDSPAFWMYYRPFDFVELNDNKAALKFAKKFSLAEEAQSKLCNIK